MPYNTNIAPNPKYGAKNGISCPNVLKYNAAFAPTDCKKQNTIDTSYTKKASGNPVAKVLKKCAIENVPTLYLNKYLNKKVIENAIKTNPNISQILSANGLTPEIYMSNIKDKKQEHFVTTMEMAKKLGCELNSDDYTTLLEASLLHDIGKALIPSDILDKPGKLTTEEKNIVDLHAKLGYEILKTTNVDSKTLEAVRLHHVGANDIQKQNNKIAQILSVSDVYSALREERPYKKQFSESTVKNIMSCDNNLNQEFVKKAFCA